MAARHRSRSLVAFDHLCTNFEADYRRLNSSSSTGSMSSDDWEVYEKLYCTPHAANVRRNLGEAAYQEVLAEEAYRANLEQEVNELKARRWYICEEKNKKDKNRFRRVARGLWCFLKEAYTNPTYVSN